MAEHQKPRVFITYAKEDRQSALDLYDLLMEIGASPWIDERKLVLGDDWKSVIENEVQRSDGVIVCLRPGFDEVGFRHQEVRWALAALQLRPPGKGFIIPFAIESCEIPDWCRKFHAGRPNMRASSFDELVCAIDKHCGSNLKQNVDDKLLSKSYSVDEYSAILKGIVRNSNKKCSLYASVGEADFAVTWMTRLIREPETRRENLSMIKSVTILRLSDHLIKALVESGNLDSDFGETVCHNIERIQSTLESVELPFNQILSNEIPKFHGWLFGDHALINNWMQDGHKKWHVRTKLTYYNNLRSPDVVKQANAIFSEK